MVAVAITKKEKLFDASALFQAESVIGEEFTGNTHQRDTSIEQRHSQPPARRKLVVLLTTTGGYIEVVQRIVATFRQHYSLVDFIIPNYAYSAGTVLAMSGDSIHMDYYSRLGPIDPQVENQRGRQVPALGYLEKYNALIEKAKIPGAITMPEVQLLIQGFDQAELHQYEQARELSIALLKEWLVRYKFKNWKKTRTRKLKVTKQMKIDRAEAIARDLNDTKKWHVHGHGIAMEVLDKDVNLQIDDFGEKNESSALNTGIQRIVFRLHDKDRYEGSCPCGG